MSHHLRRRDALSLARAHSGPNMTPMVDVTMVILIFFMASTAILGPEIMLKAGVARESVAAAPAPAASTSPFTLDAPDFTVHLRAGAAGTVVADGLGLVGASLAEAQRALAALARDLGVTPSPERSAAAPPDDNAPRIVIEAEAGVPWHAVVAVHDACLEAGLTRVSLR